MPPSLPLATPVRDVWRAHYATPAGYRLWPCEELVRAVNGQQFATVLEAGCGNGANLWMLAEHATVVWGIDSHQPALDAAAAYMRARGVRNVEFAASDIRTLPVGPASMDAVIDVMTSQHAGWDAHAAVYAEYRRVLKPGGWLFVYHLGHGTTKDGAQRLRAPFTYDHLPRLFPGVGPVCLPQAPALGAALDAAGFQPTSTRSVIRMYPDGAQAQYIVMEAVAV